MAVVVRLVLCLLLAAPLAGCAMGIFEVPLGAGAEARPTAVDRLRIGQSRREDVRAALGGDPIVLLSGDRFELYQLPTGRSSAAIVLLFPLIPVPVSGRQLEEGRLRVLAAYDASGVLQGLEWEHARFSRSPLRDERRPGESQLPVTGFEEPGGPLVVDAYGAAGSATAVDPAELPGPRLVWEADTVAAAAQGAFAALGERATGTLSIRELASGMVTASTRPAAESCGSPAYTGWLQADDRHVVIGAADGGLCLWDLRSEAPPAPLAATDADKLPRVTRIAVARRAPVAATFDAAARTVSIWDTQAGARRSALPVGELAALALSSQGERLAIVDRSGALAVLSASGAELARARLSGPHPPATSASGLAMAPDGRTIAVNRLTHVEIWRLAPVAGAAAPNALELEAVRLLPIASGVSCPVPIAFSADGGRLAAGCDSAVVWDTATLREVLRLVPDAEGRIGGAPAWIDEGFAFSADGRALLTTHGVWDVPDATPVPLG